MAWNRPSEGAAKPEPKKPSGMRGVVAGLVVVAIALGAVCYFMFDGLHETPRHKADKERGRIKEVTPAKPKVTRQNPVAAKVDPVEDEQAKARQEAEEKAAREEAIRQRLAKLPPDPYGNRRTFKTGLEQVMGWIFGIEPGNMPMPLPKIGETDRKDLVNILISKNAIKEDDPELVKFRKEQVDFAKKEMAKFIGDGGDPDDFLRYYHEQLRTFYQARNEALQQAHDLWDEDPEMGKAFVKKVNEKFANEGIKLLNEEEFE